MSAPFTFHTQRLQIRPIQSEDRSACVRTACAARLSRSEADGRMLAVSNLAPRAFDSMVSHRQMLMALDQAYFFGVFLRGASAFIGEVMLDAVVRGPQQSAIIGEVIYSPFRCQGYGEEALRACTIFGLRQLKLHRIEGQADPTNATSIKLCHRAGFHNECISRRRVKERGRWKDKLILAILRDDL